MSEHISIPMDTIASNPTEVSNVAGRHDTQNAQGGSENQKSGVLGKTPTPIYRHAAPSGPWPWMDFDEDIPVVAQIPDEGPKVWYEYPQSSFRNWTQTQVNRCKMLTACHVGESNVFKVDMFRDGKFSEDGLQMATIKDKASGAEFWDMLQRPRDERIRVRAIFVKNMTKDVLQMLGTKYDIEPFFFSSSTNWIPSRYQESLVKNQSDHITVILPFIRVIDRKAAGPIPTCLRPTETEPSPASQEDEQIIDTQSPLYLDSCDKYIFQDLLSVHMVRTVQKNTILSYHPKMRMATADQLNSLINRTGRSVYWQKNFERSKDSTCLFLCFLWYAMYEWDETFEVLYAHINQLEQLALDSADIRQTRNLHILQAHLLYYRTLLEDFRKSVLFVQTTPNPAMDDPSVTDHERVESESIMKKETDYLLSEIERLESQRMMQVMRLRNVIDLAFATVNIDDSTYMKDLTFATVRDSAAMKQISYLTMVFLPANFIANVFSMNIVEINPSGGETLAHYLIGTFLLTLFSIWIVVALQVESTFFPPGCSIWRRSGWPVFYARDMCLQMYHRILRKQKTA